MAFSSSLLFDGQRNTIVLVKADAAFPATTIVDAALLNPPCRTVSVRKITYDIGTGNVVSLFFGTGVPVPVATLSPGSGQTMNFNNFAGLYNNTPVTNRVLSASATVTGGDGVTFVLDLVKKY